MYLEKLSTLTNLQLTATFRPAYAWTIIRRLRLLFVTITRRILLLAPLVLPPSVNPTVLLPFSPLFPPNLLLHLLLPFLSPSSTPSPLGALRRPKRWRWTTTATMRSCTMSLNKPKAMPGSGQMRNTCRQVFVYGLTTDLSSGYFRTRT